MSRVDSPSARDLSIAPWATRCRDRARLAGSAPFVPALLHKSATPSRFTLPLATFPGERMKTLYTAIMLLALPVSLVAQQPSGAPPANPITTVFRGADHGLQRNLAQAFDSIPEAKFSYKPTPAQLTHRLHRPAPGERQLFLLQQLRRDEGDASRRRTRRPPTPSRRRGRRTRWSRSSRRRSSSARTRSPSSMTRSSATRSR